MAKPEKLTLYLLSAFIAAGLVVIAGTVVYTAATSYANDIKSFNVDLWGAQSRAGKVAVFDDGPNKCYVASYADNGQPAIAISCVKE